MHGKSRSAHLYNLHSVSIVCALRAERNYKRHYGEMAIYHLSMKIISRSSGYSAVASAAYRSGSLMLDERTGLTHDYTRKSGGLR